MSNSNPASKVIHGKKFENFLSDSFDKLHLRYPCEFKRVIDSAAAGNIVAKAAGDFELTVNSGDLGKPYRFRIECKASNQSETFTKGFRSLVKPHQNAQMILSHRAGICGVYLFYAVETQEVEIWYAAPLCRVYALKRQAIFIQPAFVIARKNFPAFVLEWVKNPKVVLETLIRTDKPYEGKHE